MADQKISELPAATSAAGADLLNIVQGGSNKKLTVANFLANVKTPVILNSDGGDQDQRIKGLNDDDLVFVDASTDRVGFGTATPTEKVDVDGNLAITGGFLRLSQTPQALSGVGNLTANATTAVTTIDAAGAVSLTIADGVAGQIKIITVLQAAGAVSLDTVATDIRASSVSTSSVGASLQLQWLSGKWSIISNVGFTVTL
jgi:hypothetical protein